MIGILFSYFVIIAIALGMAQGRERWAALHADAARDWAGVADAGYLSGEGWAKHYAEREKRCRETAAFLRNVAKVLAVIALLHLLAELF